VVHVEVDKKDKQRLKWKTTTENKKKGGKLFKSEYNTILKKFGTQH